MPQDWPIKDKPFPGRVDPIEKTRQIEQELPHIQREVDFRDALMDIPGQVGERAQEGIGQIGDMIRSHSPVQRGEDGGFEVSLMKAFGFPLLGGISAEIGNTVKERMPDILRNFANKIGGVREVQAPTRDPKELKK